MSPDDARHGTTAGHNAGCRCRPCCAAKLRYDKRRRWEEANGIERLVDPIGARRRIRALQAIGYAAPDIAAAVNLSPRTINDICYRGDRIRAATDDAVRRAYGKLQMTPKIGPYATRSRLLAERRGWPPPLAWDDIDTDPEPPAALYAGPDIDPVVVMRLLEGERVPSSPAEKAEAVRQWVADGGSETELCRWHGWRAGRYSRLRVVEEAS